MMRYWPLPFGKALLVALGVFPFGMLPLGLFPLGLMPVSMIQSDILPVGTSGFAGVVPAYAQSRDPIVTSDTPAYCGVLMDRITGITRTTAMPPPTDAAVLSEEGERMCVHGQTRGGILRLRRALEIMRHGED